MLYNIYVVSKDSIDQIQRDTTIVIFRSLQFVVKFYYPSPDENPLVCFLPLLVQMREPLITAVNVDGHLLTVAAIVDKQDCRQDPQTYLKTWNIVSNYCL